MGYQINGLLTTEYWAKRIGNSSNTSGSTTRLVTFGQAKSYGCRANQGSWADNQLVPVEALMTDCDYVPTEVDDQGSGCYKYLYTWGYCRNDGSWRFRGDSRYVYVGGGYTYTSKYNSSISKYFSC